MSRHVPEIFTYRAIMPRAVTFASRDWVQNDAQEYNSDGSIQLFLQAGQDLGRL